MRNKRYKNTILCGALIISMVCSTNFMQPLKAEAEDLTVVPAQEEMESVTDLGEYETNEIIVQYKDGAVSSSSLGEETPLTDEYNLIELDNRKELAETIEELEADPNVEYMQPNYTYTLTGVSNDSYSNEQWAYNNTGTETFGDVQETADIDINMAEAWGLLTSMPQKEVVVAVVDTGIDYDHPDLASHMWVNTGEVPNNQVDDDHNGYVDDVNGWNFYNNNNKICNDRLVYLEDYDIYETEDDHGTHVAGIIAATADNNEGVAGIASKVNVKIMSAKALGGMEGINNGEGSTSSITKAIQYAEQMGADICNLSLGGEGFDPIMEKVMAESHMLFIVAAGNGTYISSLDDYMGYDIDNSPIYPAAYDLDNIISVANIRCDGNLDMSSNYGKVSVDIAAPGSSILSTVVSVNNNPNRSIPYAFFGGTSMATPMVTGVAALVAAYHTDISNSQIKQSIVKSSHKLSSLTNKVVSDGMLDAFAALQYDITVPVITASQEAIKNSNYKNLIINVSRPNGEVAKVLYAQGTHTVDYFKNGTVGTEVSLVNNTAKIQIKKNGNYTIYAVDTLGNGTIRTEKVTILSVTKVKLSVSQKTLKKGKTFTIGTTLYPQAVISKVTYKSSNSKVATVNSSGKITAKSKGTAKITVTASNGKKAVCNITVK